METFSALLAICAGNSPVSGEFPAQRPVTRSFDVSVICAYLNGWVNTSEAGDLRRYRAHYDVIVIICLPCESFLHMCGLRNFILGQYHSFYPFDFSLYFYYLYIVIIIVFMIVILDTSFCGIRGLWLLIVTSLQF